MGSTKRPFPWPILVFALLFLAGCGREETPLAVNEQVQAVCTAECSDRGQCGVLSGASQAVLANEAGPAVRFHDRYFVENTLLTILAMVERQLLPAENGIPIAAVDQSFPHQFFQVANADGKTGWISEWCVARPQQ